ncbi:MAG: SDR family oxidoreductase [Chthoniobacteraceae bacterium]
MSRVLIAGCGYLGQAAATLFAARGWEVIGVTHSPQPDMVCADISDAATLAGLPACDVVVHCASSRRGGAAEYQRVYLDGARNLASVFAPARLIFTSSTSMYAQNDGSVVTEESPSEPQREPGRVLREAEELVLASGGCVARLAGIYGPERSVLLRKFFSGEAVIEGDGGRVVNQIHRDDAASALVQLATENAAGIFNVCDDTPLTQREVFAWLADHFQRPLPPAGPVDLNRKRGVTSKRVSNAKLRALGWAPQWPSFREAVAGGAT